ncbi:MAG: high-affinity nickel-transporter, partial [Bryobacteraceae bacterium]
PCPEALVVLMISISLRKLGLGLALLTVFSLGLASVLIAIGVAMVLAAPALRAVVGENRFTRSLPVASAAVVTLLGIVLVAEAAGNLRW